MYSKLLVTLDGSKAAESVLPFARILAGKLKIPVELLDIVDISVMTTHIVADKARYLDALIAAAEQSSREYLSQVAGNLPGLSVKSTVERGKPADVIIEKAAAEKGTLIAMATHGRSGINRWLLGSVAEKVLRGTSHPLFLVRANEAATTESEVSMGSVIVPLDGSVLAESVLPATVEIAKVFDLEVLLFRAFEMPASAYSGREDYLPNYDELKKEFKAEAQRYLDAQVDALKAKGLTRVTPILNEGSAAEEIIRCARAHANSLVAMCTHGRSGVKRWMLGSVTEKVVRHSGAPVLVARA